MSRLITSESDTDNDSSRSTTLSESSQHDLTRDVGTYYGRVGNEPSITMERKLEHYTRKLSQVGLEDKEDSSISSDSELLAPSQTNMKESFEDIQPQEKVQIKFMPIGSIATMVPTVFKISSSQPFSMVLSFLKKKLKIQDVYCYINNSFAPNPQQVIGDLWQQFKINDELIVSYCGTVAFG